MVRKIKIVEVYTKPEAGEEATSEPTPSGEATHSQASENTEPTIEPMVHEASDTEHEPEPPPPPPPPPETKSEEGEQSSPARKPKQMLNMPTTPKILQQVECQACKRKMSAKVLRYSHAKYCTEREREEQPEAIPIPKLKIKNGEHLKEQTSLPVKNLKLKLKRTTTTTYTAAEKETEAKPQTPPPQPQEMEQSFHHKMKQRIQEKEAKYQNMMSNAF
jgi:hypothetical protein